MEEKRYKAPKDFSQKFVEELRNNNYEQITGILTNGENKFCALGVACIVLGFPLEIIDGKKYFTNERGGYFCLSDLHKFIEYDLIVKIYQLNDSDGLSFYQIADWYEQNVEYI